MAFHQYNTTQYNVSQYNADASLIIKRFSESVASSDVKANNALQALADSISSSDARVIQLLRVFSEFSFLSDVVTKAVLAKGFSEGIRINDWVQFSRKDQGNSNGWSS